ncbi:hypothetical protein [Novosphingobium sp.]|uniref:hypothetical protein n=1 Tax=Novosphingobium sp. TaxID=1874826 RepID=UPI003D11A29B
MNHKTRMLAGAAAIALGASLAFAPLAMADPIPVANSYADLLVPVPDAMARLHADDAIMADAQVIPAQLSVGINLGHHHHHHHHSARWYRSHGYSWNGQVWLIGPPRYWHNHHSDWYRQRGYAWDGNVWREPSGRGQYHHHHHHHHHHHQNWR